MASNKQLWRIGIERTNNRMVVIARIATNMFDKHIDILALKAIQFTIHQTQVAPIAITTYRTKRPKLS